MNYEDKYNKLVEKTIDVLTYDIDSLYYEEAHNELLYALCKERGYELDEEQRIKTCNSCGEYVTKVACCEEASQSICCHFRLKSKDKI